MLGFAIAELHWTEQQFWNSTVHALYAALEFHSGAAAEGEKRRKFAEFKKSVLGAGA